MKKGDLIILINPKLNGKTYPDWYGEIGVIEGKSGSGWHMKILDPTTNQAEILYACEEEIEVIDHLKNWDPDCKFVEPLKMPKKLEESFLKGDWGCQKASVQRVLETISELLEIK